MCTHPLPATLHTLTTYNFIVSVIASATSSCQDKMQGIPKMGLTPCNQCIVTTDDSFSPTPSTRGTRIPKMAPSPAPVNPPAAAAVLEGGSAAIGAPLGATGGLGVCVGVGWLAISKDGSGGCSNTQLIAGQVVLRLSSVLLQS